MRPGCNVHTSFVHNYLNDRDENVPLTRMVATYAGLVSQATGRQGCTNLLFVPRHTPRQHPLFLHAEGSVDHPLNRLVPASDVGSAFIVIIATRQSSNAPKSHTSALTMASSARVCMQIALGGARQLSDSNNTKFKFSMALLVQLGTV